jgi:hypothetical protein
MGQSRYGRLPKTENWQTVVALLASPQVSPARAASATVKACRTALQRHSDDPVLGRAVYLLCRLPLASRQGKASHFLREEGMNPDALSAPTLLSEEVASTLYRQNFSNADPSFVPEIAVAAMQETLSKLMAESNLDLFADASGQLEKALAAYGTPRGFAGAARIFFTSFMQRTLAYFLAKETANVLGLKGFDSLDSLQSFLGDLRRYCWESSKIIDDFAEEWYSKNKWQERLDLPHVGGFVWAALRKFAAEIGREHE